jgi:DnaJ like chaperone protein
MWGKLGGTGLGLAIGGPLGALLGGLAGHFLLDREGAPFRRPPREVIFTTGLVALSAKMARADGVVTRDEVAAFRRIIEVPEDGLGDIIRLFDLAKATTAGFEAYARQLRELLADEPQLLEDVLDGLFLIATADGAVHDGEVTYLKSVAEIFGLTGSDYARIEARHLHRDDDPYAILGATRDMDGEELKRRYRQLAHEFHPDREIARGLPPEAIKIATSRLAAINAAWDMIARERGLT